MITRNWRTTALGIIVIGLGAYLGITGGIPWGQFWAFVAAGFALVLAEDGK